MNITVKAMTGTTAGKKYPTLYSMTRLDEKETWIGNLCTIERTKTVSYAVIKDDLLAEKKIYGVDILTVEI